MQARFEKQDEDIWAANCMGWRILFLKRSGFVNATQLCLDAKLNVEDWIATNSLLLDSCKEYISPDLSCIQEISDQKYIHPSLVQNLAAWISPTCAVAVSFSMYENFKVTYMEKLLDDMFMNIRQSVENFDFK